MPTNLISPSILAANFLELGKDIRMLNESDADYIHCDIMDGAFVPNISYGFPIVEQVYKLAQKPLDVHLMIQNPDFYIEAFAKAGAKILTVHYEACPHLHRTIQHIKANGMLAGVSLNPHTPVSLIEPIIKELDLVLIMSVNPGFGGQKFIAHSIEKVAETKALKEATQSNCIIEVDGGVNLETGKLLLDAGADMLVAGSFVFKAESPKEVIKQLKEL